MFTKKIQKNCKKVNENDCNRNVFWWTRHFFDRFRVNTFVSNYLCLPKNDHGRYNSILVTGVNDTKWCYCLQSTQVINIIFGAILISCRIRSKKFQHLLNKGKLQEFSNCCVTAHRQLLHHFSFIGTIWLRFTFTYHCKILHMIWSFL